jgi:cell division protein FtsB
MRLSRPTKFAPVVSLGCLLILGYFAWHAWHGPRGYEYQEQLSGKLALLEADRMDVAKRRSILEARVSLMRPEHVDLDMLDELARKTLSMLRSNELVIAD